jgi:phosphopantetheine--protein transferase-like protein
MTPAVCAQRLEFRRIGIDCCRFRERDWCRYRENSSQAGLSGYCQAVFSAREVQAILAVSENKRQEAFFACWTRKEAFLKATGIGLSYPLSQFSVSVDPDAPAELWEVKGDPDAVTHWSLESVRPGAGYMGALAYKGPARRVEWLCQADCPLPADIV